MLGRCIDRSSGSDLVPGDRGDVDDVSGLLSLHDRQHGADAVEDAFDIDVDGAIPVIDLAAVEW
jgi:hypothetical protein